MKYFNTEQAARNWIRKNTLDYQMELIFFENEYGVKLPRIRNVTDVEKYYSPKRLLDLKNQGLDIKKASQKLGYTLEMPKGAITATEFVEPGSKGENFLNNFIYIYIRNMRLYYLWLTKIN